VPQKETGWQKVNVSYFFVFVYEAKVSIATQRWLQKVTNRKKWGMSCNYQGTNREWTIGDQAQIEARG
jgi:hypothetical protein